LAQGPGDKGCRGDRGEGGPQMRIERMAKHLDLNEEQVAAITEIQTKGRAAILELRKDMMRLQNEKRGEMLKDDPSEKKVLDLTRKIGELKTTMQTNRAGNRLAVRKLLTPAQRDQMLMMGEHRGGRGGHGGRGGRDCAGKMGERAGSGDNMECNGQCAHRGSGRRGAR
jgi:Spy/CpxP family protein refolding chaperone